MRNLRDKSILVTGGAGFLGSHFLDYLVHHSQAKEIVVVDNFFLGSIDNLNLAKNSFANLKIVRADARNYQAMESIVLENRIYAVFDFATVPLPASLKFPIWTLENNIETTSTLCELARKQLIENFVHISSSEAYGSALHSPMSELHPLAPSTPYAASKAAEDLIIDSYVQTYGIKSLIVRPFNNYGPRQNLESYAGVVPIFIDAFKNKKPLRIYGDGLQTRDFIFVKDTARYIFDLYCQIKDLEGVYNLGTGVETNIMILGKTIGDILGLDTQYEFLPARPGDVRRHCADISRLVSVLGNRPPSITKEALSETIEFFWSRL